MAKTTANISIDADVKAQAQELFAALGMDLSTAVNLFLIQAINYDGIPFEIRRKPNDISAAAMEEFERAKSNPEEYKRYSSFEDALKDALGDT